MTNETPSIMQNPNAETLAEIDNALHSENGKNAVFIAETPEDWQTLLLAKFNVYMLDPVFSSPARILEMLQMEPSHKTIIVCNKPETFPVWQDMIRKAKETTTAEIEFIPTEIRKRISQLNENILTPNAGKILKKIETYRAAIEEQATPKPGNVLEYLNTGRYAADLENFQKSAGIKTGFSLLDLKLGGIYAGLYVLGAVPTLGKTTFLLQIADQVAAQKKPVLFFSMEQSRLELVTKSIARTARKQSPGNQRGIKNSMQLKKGYDSPEMQSALEYYRRNIAPYMNIIEGNFETTAGTIKTTVERFIKRNNEMPVVILDYLQLLQPTKGTRAIDQRMLVDQNLTALKRLSRDNEIPVIAISSLNRTNYNQQIDYESFKETGGIEHTVDVLLGLEYKVISTLDGKNTNQDRQKIKDAKAANPREIKFICIKNRFGAPVFDINYKYFSEYDYFIEEPANYSNRDLFKNVPMR